MVEYENRPKDHDIIMLKNWTSMIAWDDLVIHLGDLFFKDGSKYLPQLTGRIVLVRGNHDNKSVSWYLDNGINFVCDTFTLKAFGKHIVFSHEPINNLPEKYDLNIHGHFHSITHRDISSIPNYETDKRYSLFTIELEDYMPVELGEFIVRDFRRLPKERNNE